MYWTAAGGLQVDVSEHCSEPACLRIKFPCAHAFQAIDEGYRLQDMAIGNHVALNKESVSPPAASQRVFGRRLRIFVRSIISSDRN